MFGLIFPKLLKKTTCPFLFLPAYTGRLIGVYSTYFKSYFGLIGQGKLDFVELWKSAWVKNGNGKMESGKWENYIKTQGETMINSLGY